MFLLLMTMAGIGFLIKYTLISGEKQNIYGTNTNLEFWGLDSMNGNYSSYCKHNFCCFYSITHYSSLENDCVFLKRLIPNKTYELFLVLCLFIWIAPFIFGFVVTPSRSDTKTCIVITFQTKFL